MIGKISSVSSVNNQRSLNFAASKSVSAPKIYNQSQNFAPLPLGNIYGAKINFTGRRKKTQPLTPAQELYAQASRNSKIKTDNWTLEHMYLGVNHPEKRWVAGVEPKELLNRDLKDAINSIMTLQYGENAPDKIPSNIK